jgi:hypothetical protein
MPNHVTLIESLLPNVYNIISRQDYHNLLNKPVIHIRKQDDGLIVVEKINARSCLLESVASVSTGRKTYQTGKGKPPKSNEDKENRIYHSTKKVKRYSLVWSGEYLCYG